MSGTVSVTRHAYFFRHKNSNKLYESCVTFLFSIRDDCKLPGEGQSAPMFPKISLNLILQGLIYRNTQVIQ